MKRLLIFSVLALSTGCIEPNAVLLLNAEVLDDKCVTTGTQIYAGNVNLASTSSYFVAFAVQSELDATDVTVNGNIVNPASRNDFVASTAVLNYVNASTGASLGIPEQHIAMSAVVPAGARAADSYIVLNLLNPTVAASIASAGQVAVQVKLVGRLLSSSAVLSTNTVQFPLSVVNEATCADPVVPVPPCCKANSAPPCGNPSQDVSCFF